MRRSIFEVAKAKTEVVQMIGSNEELPSDDENLGSSSSLDQKKHRVLTKLKMLSRMDLVKKSTIDKLPDKCLLAVFTYLHHKQILRCARVCRKWRSIAHDSRLWQVVSLRPDYQGLSVTNADMLLQLIGSRFGPQLRLIELPMELIQIPIIHELANKCPRLQYLTLDFSTAVQLHEFTDLQSFPARLRSLTICLSEVIFLEGFVKKMYSFISSLEILHLIGTFEKIEDEEQEVYEVVNLHKLKQHTPNLRVINLWGVVFVTDEHIESLSTNCAHIECLCVNFCQKVKGTSLKILVQRCRKLKCLLLEQCLLDSKAVAAVDWEKSQIQEINITATELSTECLISMLGRLAHLRWLSAGYLENFTDAVLEALMGTGCKNLLAIDLDTSDSISEEMLTRFIQCYGLQLQGIGLGGHFRLIESFWLSQTPKMANVKMLTMGIAEDCCPKVTAKIHIDQFIDCIANNCPRLERLEIRWDPGTLRFSDKSSKFIDILRMRCLKMHALVLCDGQYFEMVKSNFERADRVSVVRATNYCKNSISNLLTFYQEMLFN